MGYPPISRAPIHGVEHNKSNLDATPRRRMILCIPVDERRMGASYNVIKTALATHSEIYSKKALYRNNS